MRVVAVESCGEGPVVDVAELYAQHRLEVYRIALRFGGSAWAEDVTHDVFVKVLARLHDAERLESVAAWLRTVTYRACITKKRTERVRATLLGVLTLGRAKDASTPHDIAVANETARRIRSILLALPAPSQAAFWMRLRDGMSVEDVSATLHCSKGQVSKLVARALDALRHAGLEVADA